MAFIALLRSILRAQGSSSLGPLTCQERDGSCGPPGVCPKHLPPLRIALFCHRAGVRAARPQCGISLPRLGCFQALLRSCGMRPEALLWRTLLLWLPLCAPARAVSSDCSDTKSNAGSGSLSEIQWSYDKATDTCESFLYRGNGKSNNRFSTEHQCMADCSHRYQDLYPVGAGMCSLSVDKGPCMAFLLMWYYDSVNKKCDTFFYGGCHGNGNRFDSRHNCTSTCTTSKKGKSGGASAAEEDESAPPSSNEGTIVAIVFSVIFAVAFIVTLTMFIRQRKAMKKREQKHKFVAVEMQQGDRGGPNA